MKPGDDSPAPARKLRVVIATVTAGAGHLQAAAALQEAWTALRPGDVIKQQDVLVASPRLLNQVHLSSDEIEPHRALDRTSQREIRVLSGDAALVVRIQWADTWGTS